MVELTHDGAEAHIDALAKKYLDADTYPMRKEGEVRVTIKIEAEKILGWGRGALDAFRESQIPIIEDLNVATPDGAVERYNNKLMAWAVAFAHCDPNDASRPSEELGMPGDDEIEERLTPESADRYFDRINAALRKAMAEHPRQHG